MAFEVGKRVAAESESTDRRSRSDVVEEVLRGDPSLAFGRTRARGSRSAGVSTGLEPKVQAQAAPAVKARVGLWSEDPLGDEQVRWGAAEWLCLVSACGSAPALRSGRHASTTT